jgi:hypothetical protein
MAIPDLGQKSYNENNRDIKSQVESSYTQAITINMSYWGEADTDARFEAGDQDVVNNYYGNVPATLRRSLRFNLIRPIVNVIDGYQIRNRKSIVAIPVENGDEHTSDQLTKILMDISRREGILETISDAFRGALITGMNFLHIWVDYRNDPISGDIRVDNCPYNTFVMDPYFRKPDLSDCNFMWRRSYMTKKSIISLLPDKEEEILSLQSNGDSSGRDGKFQFMPETYNTGMKNLLSYDEYYYREYRTQIMLVDTQTGESTEWMGRDKEQLEEYLAQYPTVKSVEQEIPTVRLAILVEGRVMYDGPQPSGLDVYPFVPVFAYYNPQLPYFDSRIQGVVRGLRDAQFLYNRRKIIELDILESQMNSGWIYKENALVNPADVFLSGQGKGLALKQEASMADVQQIVAPQIPPSMFQLSEILDGLIQKISGVNEELLGSAVDDKAGILSMLRQGAGLTSLQRLFDNLDHAQKLLGTIMISLIQKNYTPGKVQKILNGDKPAPLFYNKAWGKYGVAVEEGLNTTTQRQMQFAQMLELRAAGVPITDQDLLEASTLQNKNKIIENAMRSQQQAQQVQQAQMQSELQEQAARINLANARAAADQGLGIERLSRVDENEALATERRSQSVLDMAKALNELEGINVDQIQKLVSIIQTLKQSEQNAEQRIPRQNEMQG